MRIGIIVPAFNAAPWIGDAIASVLAQTHTDWRLVVVDDGSTDGTGELVARFADPRIQLIRQANAGVSVARNTGLAMFHQPSSRPERSDEPGPRRACTAATLGPGSASPPGMTGRVDALLFLDADDWLAPDALSRLAAALEAAPCAVAASGPYLFAGRRRVRSAPHGDVLPRLLVRNLFANGGHLLLRWETVRRAGSFAPGIAYGEDWEYWIRIALEGVFARAPGRAPLLFVRRHDEGAYRRLASDPAAFAPCMRAIFCNRALATRFGATRLAAIRRRTEAENDWIIGRELIRHGEPRSGRTYLRRSLQVAPNVKRASLLMAAHLLGLLPDDWRGPFRAYARP